MISKITAALSGLREGTGVGWINITHRELNDPTVNKPGECGRIRIPHPGCGH